MNITNSPPPPPPRCTWRQPAKGKSRVLRAKKYIFDFLRRRPLRILRLQQKKHSLKEEGEKS